MVSMYASLICSFLLDGVTGCLKVFPSPPFFVQTWDGLPSSLPPLHTTSVCPLSSLLHPGWPIGSRQAACSPNSSLQRPLLLLLLLIHSLVLSLWLDGCCHSVGATDRCMYYLFNNHLINEFQSLIRLYWTDEWIRFEIPEKQSNRHTHIREII